ncbi:MAG: fibronectin type III domain-containing protein, partial [Duncaniella sp.]|nr:fibronectin type III domain-containing protein [Duncaniella sp.]
MRVRVYEIISGLIVAMLASILTGCASTDDPQNLEPSIIIREATDITRFEATVSAAVERRGTGMLSYVRFMYREGDDGVFVASDDILSVGDEVTFHLTGLKAGTTYTYYAVGGTATAVIESDRLTFTTEPNQLPKVKGVCPLSTGPTGIIVRFEITDDGGEPLEQAGCEILNRVTGEKSRIYVPDDLLAVGYHRLTIRPLKVGNEYVITSFVSTRMGETFGDPFDYTTKEALELEEPGVMSHVLDVAGIRSESLTISGPMNGDDFRYLRRLLDAPSAFGEAQVTSDLSEIDLTDVRISEGGGTYD